MNVFNWLNRWFIRWLTSESLPPTIPMCDFERIHYEIRPCDVVLVEGRSRVSEVIKMITQSPWSHSALYIGRLHDIENPKLRNLLSLQFHGPPDTQLLLESVLGRGTVITPLSAYEKDHVRICRPKGLSRQDAQHVIAYAITKLGNQYDVRHVFDLARFFFPWGIIPRKFRSSLFTEHAGQSIRNVCSSMIAEAFSAVEFPILPLVTHDAAQNIELINRNTKLFTPRDFDYSPYFEIIKFPFLEIAENPAYRNLPWNKEGRISNDHVGITDVKQMTDFEMDLPKPKKKKKLPSIQQIKNHIKNNYTKKHPAKITPEPGDEPPLV